MPALYAFLFAVIIAVAPLQGALAQGVTTEPLPAPDAPTEGQPVDGVPADGVPGEERETEEEEEEEEQGPIDVYTVTDIPVDVTAATTSAAREQAFAEGRREGLLRLGEDLGLASFPQTVENLNDFEVDQLVQSFSVANERTTPGRYIADLTFVYEPTAIRGLLREGRVASSQVTNEEIAVIIPVYEPGLATETRLWDSPNPWFDAWLDYDPSAVATEIIVPFGDFRDLSDLSAPQALIPDTVGVASLAERYGARRGVVAVARPSPGTLDVSLFAVRGTALQANDFFSLPVNAGGEAQALQEAVAEVARRIDETLFIGLFAAGPTTPVASGGNAATLMVSVPIEAPADWYRVVATLDQTPLVVGNTLVSLGPREAIVRLEHLGNHDQLRSVLAEQALDLRSVGSFSELRPIFR